MTQQMGQMNMGGAAAQPQGQAAPLQLNRLQATDLISHPFYVAEMDSPPPAIILPPNVSVTAYAAVSSPSLTNRTVQRHTLARRELPAKIRTLHT